MDFSEPHIEPLKQQRSLAPRWLLLCVLLFVPLFLRLWPVGHGLPENYLADTHVVRNALGMARDKNPVPPGGTYSSYPYFLPYCLLPVYAGQYALGRATGDWAGAGEFGAQVLENPGRVHLPARVLVALFGVLTVFFVYRVARRAGQGPGALIAAWLVATGLLHIHFSIQERPWGPMTMFMALSAWPAANFMLAGKRRDLLLTGLCAGLAAATHQAGLLALAIPGLAWLMGPAGWRGPELKRRFIDGVLAVACFSALALVLGHPYLFVHGPSQAESFTAQPDLDITVGGQGMVFELRMASTVRLAKALIGYDPALVVLALLGLMFGIARRGTRVPTLFAVGWLAFFLTNQNDHVRYLLPACVLLAWPAGWAGEMLWKHRIGRFALLPLLFLPLVQALRMGSVLRAEDTRAEAARLCSMLPDGARVAVDRYGPVLALNQESLQRLSGWRELSTREGHRLELLTAGLETQDGAGLDALSLGDVFLFFDRTQHYFVDASAPIAKSEPQVLEVKHDAQKVLRSLGVTHVMLVDRRPGDGQPSLLLPEAKAGGHEENPAPLRLAPKALFTVDPSSSAEPAQEAFLPTEMEFPLTQLWAVKRPGPRIELFALGD